MMHRVVVSRAAASSRLRARLSFGAVLCASPFHATLRFASSTAAPKIERTRADDEIPPEATQAKPQPSARVDVKGDGEQPGAHVGAGNKYDPWLVLGLKAGAPAYEIRLRYHELMQQCHPSFALPEKVDLEKWAEIDKAYNLVVATPTMDHQYRNLVTPRQQLYYRILPEWMARNVDDSPRWYGWMKLRMDRLFFVVVAAALSYAVGRSIVVQPAVLAVLIFAILSDWLLGTAATPFVLCYAFFRVFTFNNQSNDLSWLQSPKQFLQRGYEY